MIKAQRPSRFAVILAFGLVYLFWGSTYLAIDIAVQTIPPALMCAVRFSIAGVVMLAVCAVTGRRIWYSAKQIVLASVVGILLLMGGNLTLSWPLDHTGWTLQVQTNSLSTNWVTVTGSSITNQMIIPINPANGSEFFRLVYP